MPSALSCVSSRFCETSASLAASIDFFSPIPNAAMPPAAARPATLPTVLSREPKLFVLFAALPKARCSELASPMISTSSLRAIHSAYRVSERHEGVLAARASVLLRVSGLLHRPQVSVDFLPLAQGELADVPRR